MNTEKERPRATLYLLLLVAQIIGALFFFLNVLPSFRQLLLNPGEQPPNDPHADLMTLVAVVLMQIAYWYRQLRVAIPFLGPNVILGHVFLFFGRLSFIFGSALFAAVFFRHLPELEQGADILLSIRRGILLVGSLFALFCFTLELERLGQALGNGPESPPASDNS
jgi:hypothetical protein